MNKYFFLFLALPLLANPAFAQQRSLSDQIDAVGAAQDRDLERQNAARRAYQEQVAREQEAQRKAALAVQNRKLAEEKAAREEASADKKRDQSYEDQLRALQLRQAEEAQKVEEQKSALELERLKTRTSRENEFEDRELKKQDAQTDVIQSEADSKRNMSSGSKSLLEGAGVGLAKPEKPPSRSWLP